MEYSDSYMYSKDIDWFFSINNKLFIHAASAGGLLPKQINDRDKLRNIQKKVFELPDIYSINEIRFNETFLLERFNNGDGIDNYLTSFVEMAMKGFISMDRTNLEILEDNRYHIVCMPKRLEPIEGLQEIFKIEHREQTFYEPTSNINLLELF